MGVKRVLPMFVACLCAVPVEAKDSKVHGYVTAVRNATSFDIDDYRIMRDESVTIEFDRDDDDEEAADFPKDIRVGSEIEIRGEYNDETHELKARSVKVFTRESHRLKRAAILNEAPQLRKAGAFWEGSFRADGQRIVVDETTLVMIVPNTSQKKAAKQAAKDAKKGGPDGAEAAGQVLARLDDVHVGMYVSYEGARLDDGRIRAKKVQFRDNEMTSAEARLWKSLTPKVTAFKATKPGELKLGAAGKFKLTPNDEVQNYLRNLAGKLVPESQKRLAPGDPNRIPFQFFLAESKAANAFATANGVVVVLAPMLAMAETEGQLAAVLAHEIAHSTQEHTLRQMEFHKKKRMLLSIGAAFAAGYGAYSVRDLLNLTSAAITNGYQRYLENQADRIGMEYMLAAGYDPREAPRFWKTLSLKAGDGPTNFFWSNHDNNTTRRSYLMSELAVNYTDTDFDSLKTTSPEFVRIRGIVSDLYSKHKKIKVKF